MTEPTPAQKAYGMLWLDQSTSQLVHGARHQLRDSLSPEERRAGVKWACEAFGPVTTSQVSDG